MFSAFFVHRSVPIFSTMSPKPKPRSAASKTATANTEYLTSAVRVKAEQIRRQLGELYPPPVPIPLHHKSPFQLLVAVMLSAQSTDKVVNEVTPELFSRAPDAQSMAGLPVETIESLIKRVGLAPTKSRNLSRMAQLLAADEGRVPNSFEGLEALPGVGHKTASVVMSQAFGVPAFPVDTHIHRLAQRWGLSSGASVEQSEADLKELFTADSWNDLHLQIIYFGREHCPAQKHDPAACPICSWAGR